MIEHDMAIKEKTTCFRRLKIVAYSLFKKGEVGWQKTKTKRKRATKKRKRRRRRNKVRS